MKETIKSLTEKLKHSESLVTHWRGRFDEAEARSSERHERIKELQSELSRMEDRKIRAERQQERQTLDTLAYFASLATPALGNSQAHMEKLLARISHSDYTPSPDICRSMEPKSFF